MTKLLDIDQTNFQISHLNQRYYKQKQSDYSWICKFGVAGGFQLLYNYY